MPAFAFTRQPDALAWFGTGRGGAVLASEQARVSQALTSSTPGPWLWVSPDGVEPAPAGDIPPMRGVRLHARSGAQRLTGQVRCGLPLPLPTEAVAVIVVQHLAGISAEPGVRLEEGARGMVPGGRLWLVANRQLPYEEVLDARFASVRIVAQRDGFKVVEAVKAR